MFKDESTGHGAGGGLTQLSQIHDRTCILTVIISAPSLWGNKVPQSHTSLSNDIVSDGSQIHKRYLRGSILFDSHCFEINTTFLLEAF